MSPVDETVRHAGLLRRVALPGFVERLEDGLGVFEIVVHDVDEVRGRHHIVDELARWRIGFIELCPLLSKFERFVLIITTSLVCRW